MESKQNTHLSTREPVRKCDGIESMGHVEINRGHKIPLWSVEGKDGGSAVDDMGILIQMTL